MRKNWQSGGESLLKNGTIDGYAKHVIPGPDLHCARPLTLRGFLQHLPAKYTVNEDQKKSYYLRAGPWHQAIWLIWR